MQYQEEVHNIINQLSPKFFNYIDDKSKIQTIGLIADDVEKTGCEILVARNEDNELETVNYHLLPMYLLVEQKTNKLIEELMEKNKKLREIINKLI